MFWHFSQNDYPNKKEFIKDLFEGLFPIFDQKVFSIEKYTLKGNACYCLFFNKVKQLFDIKIFAINKVKGKYGYKEILLNEEDIHLYTNCPSKFIKICTSSFEKLSLPLSKDYNNYFSLCQQSLIDRKCKNIKRQEINDYLKFHLDNDSMKTHEDIQSFLEENRLSQDKDVLKKVNFFSQYQYFYLTVWNEVCASSVFIPSSSKEKRKVINLNTNKKGVLKTKDIKKSLNFEDITHFLISQSLI